MKWNGYGELEPDHDDDLGDWKYLAKICDYDLNELYQSASDGWYLYVSVEYDNNWHLVKRYDELPEDLEDQVIEAFK